MIILLISTLAVLVGSWRFTAALGLRRNVDVVTAWLVVLAAQICLLVLGVGLAGQLRPIPLALAAGTLAAGQVLWSCTTRYSAARRSSRRLRAVVAHGLRRPWRHPLLLTLGVLVAVQYLWRLALAVRLPIMDWDGNYYHLISVDTWVQHGALTHTPQVIFADTYPQNSELITAWSATFLHNTWLAGLTQFLFVAMGTVAVIGLASNAGAGRSRAVFAGLIFAATPIVFVQVTTAYVDIAASATVLATWQLLLSAYDARGGHRDGRSRLTAMFLVAGLGIGMMLGTKSSNVVSAALAVLLALVIVVGHWRTRPPPSSAGPVGRPAAPPVPGMGGLTVGGGGTALLVLPAAAPELVIVGRRSFWRYAALPLAALAVPALLVGGFWYIRNLITYGNPLWPVTVPFFHGQGTVGQLLQSNVPAELQNAGPLTQIGRSWVTDLSPHAYGYDQRLGGFGPQWILLLFPATAVMIFGFLRDKMIYLFGLVLPFTALLFLRPEPWWSRYTLFLAGLGAVCFVLAVKWLAGRWEWVLHGALVVLVAVGMWWATSPTDVVAGAPTHTLTPTQAYRLILADSATRASSPYPWSGYTALAGAAPGAVVAVPDRNKLIFTHPYIGTDLSRHLVVIPTPHTGPALYAALVAAHADYVVLDPEAAPTAALAKAALHDRRFHSIGPTFDGLLFTVRR